VDVNPDPDVVEVNLVATVATHSWLPGKPAAEAWAYRDGSVPGSRATVPGPLLEAKAGDRVIVHFRNELPESTTMHFHGIRLTNANDGTMASQQPVFPGESWDYDFHVPDAGTFWYHPHMRADVQIEKGLYAPMIVHGDPVTPEVSADRLFVLDDVKLEASGQLAPDDDDMDMMVGRQGNVLAVNGVNATIAAIDAKAGARERWRFANAANGRFFDLKMKDGTPFLVIAWDGGMLPQPYAADTLLITPGERYEVLVDVPAAGTSLQNVYYDRGHDLPDPGPIDLFQVRVHGTAPAPPPLPSTWGVVAPLAVDASTPVRVFTLAEDMPAGQEPTFTINGERWPFNTPIGALYGATEIWEIDNTAEMDHPFHLHGMLFQVLDRDGVPETTLGWKDTVNVKQGSTVRFAVKYGSPGMWMFHCHILEHAERGMMGSVMVSEPGVP
jgi:FtsP/CotA-like multicopper oxidase with cupredoxin domain